MVGDRTSGGAGPKPHPAQPLINLIITTTIITIIIVIIIGGIIMDEKTLKKIEALRAEYRQTRVVVPLKSLMFWAAEEVDGDLRVMKLDTSQARKAWIAEDRDHRFKISSAEARKIMITQLDSHGWCASHSVIERRGLPYMGNQYIHHEYQEYVTD